LAKLRAGGADELAARRLLAAGDPEADALRAQVASELATTLRARDRATTRWLLAEETAALAARGDESETFYTLIAALARFGQPSDALALWRARETSAATRIGVDAEQFARAGWTATRDWLASVMRGGGSEAAEARAALAWLDRAAAEGRFGNLPEYFAWSDQRYSVQVSGSACQVGGVRSCDDVCFPLIQTTF
jgi:hypothetical protein